MLSGAYEVPCGSHETSELESAQALLTHYVDPKTWEKVTALPSSFTLPTGVRACLVGLVAMVGWALIETPGVSSPSHTSHRNGFQGLAYNEGFGLQLPGALGSPWRCPGPESKAFPKGQNAALPSDWLLSSLLGSLA